MIVLIVLIVVIMIKQHWVQQDWLQKMRRVLSAKRLNNYKKKMSDINGTASEKTFFFNKKPGNRY